jgi:hypothetical protein
MLMMVVLTPPVLAACQVLVRELLKVLDDSLKHEVVYWASFYEHRIQVSGHRGW